MVLLIFFTLLAAGVRLIGAVSRPFSPIPIRIAGWLLGGLGAWLLLIAAGAYQPPLWTAVLPLLLGVVMPTESAPLGSVAWRRQTAVIALFDLAILLVGSGLALPPLGWGALAGTAVVGTLLLALIDQIARLAPLFWRQAGWVGLAALILIGGVGGVVTRDTWGRLLNGGIGYLWQDAPQDPPPIEREVTWETAVVAPEPILIPNDQTAQPVMLPQFAPYAEWVFLPETAVSGNPFDVQVTATFTHESGETITTGLFYDGAESWRLRFTGTTVGDWTFVTTSEVAGLNGRSGQVTVTPNPGVPGFVTHQANKWARTGTDAVFVPQLVMIGGPQTFYNNTPEIQYNIHTFLHGHGFNGVHTAVFCRWFDMHTQSCGDINQADPNPDPRTFEALEQLIRDVHAAGGVVHIWLWGDDSRRENPKRWGLNGPADQRLQRYIAARLGPLPGWTMGYGYDLFEWVDGDQLDAWHATMQAELGWPHLLGARADKNQLTQLTESLDYAAYEQHRPTYQLYVQSIEARPTKPSFSEDRFRIRDAGQAKDYTMELTRRGLWDSTMAGGVANIWGNLIGAPLANNTLTTSAPYPNPEQIQTYATFWQDRFLADMARCNEWVVTENGRCLHSPVAGLTVLYAEDVDQLIINADLLAGATVLAVDAKRPYAEISVTMVMDGETAVLPLPTLSDWAVVVENN